jgi:ribosome modulation factor
VNDVTRAGERARRLYPKSKAHQSVYVKGARAALAGRGESACPYARDPNKTWLRGYRKAWLRGHQSIPRRAG